MQMIGHYDFSAYLEIRETFLQFLHLLINAMAKVRVFYIRKLRSSVHGFMCSTLYCHKLPEQGQSACYCEGEVVDAFTLEDAVSVFPFK